MKDNKSFIQRAGGHLNQNNPLQFVCNPPPPLPAKAYGYKEQGDSTQQNTARGESGTPMRGST